MSENMWGSGNTGTEVKGLCLEECMLLAYTRQQLQPEEYELVRQHIGHCQQCRQKCIRYTFLNQKLDVLMEMVNKEPYPEMSTEATYQNVVRRFQEEKIRRKALAVRLVESIREVILSPTQRRKSGFGWAYALIPALLLIVLSVIVIKSHLPSNMQPNGLSGQGKSVPIVSQRTTSGPSSKPTVTVRPRTVTSPTAKPTATPALSSYLRACTTNSDLKEHMLRICGYNFTPGGGVALTIFLRVGKSPSSHTIVVNAQGDFQVTFTISSCKFVPSGILAEDVTTGTYTTPLLSISFAKCPVANSSASDNKGT